MNRSITGDFDEHAQKKIVLLGAGGHCESVIDSILRVGVFNNIVITDPVVPCGERIMGCEVVGDDSCLCSLKSEGYEYAFITVGSVKINPVREKLVNKALKYGYKFPVIIDPSAIVADTAFFEAGAFIGKNVVINTGAQIGAHCIINTGAIVEHGCKIGKYSHISVGAILCGGVEVGTNSFIGAGSTVIQGIHIGEKVVVGANTTVISDVEDCMKYLGIMKSSI